jgi:hypothetical protein
MPVEISPSGNLRFILGILRLVLLFKVKALAASNLALATGASPERSLPGKEGLRGGTPVL